MSVKVDIIVENKLIKEKRDIHVYHQSTRSAHIISRGSSITLPLRTTVEDDYLYISVVRGPGNLWKESVIDLPSWADFEFSLEGKVVITHSGNRTLLKISPGPPTWQLKMTMSNDSPVVQMSDHIIIGDNGNGPDGKE